MSPRVHTGRALSHRHAHQLKEAAAIEDNPLAPLVAAVPGLSLAVARSVLRKVMDLDASERQVLLTTLSTWFQTRGNAKEAARLLYCHRNTVGNRLRRLEHLSGRSVNDPRGVAELLIAVEAICLLQLAPPRPHNGEMTMADDPDGPAFIHQLAAITKQMEAATSALYETALTPADLPSIADHLRELVEYGWRLANAAADHVQNAQPRSPIRLHENFGDAEIYLTHTQDLLSVAITTASKASTALREMAEGHPLCPFMGCEGDGTEVYVIDLGRIWGGGPGIGAHQVRCCPSHRDELAALASGNPPVPAPETTIP